MKLSINFELEEFACKDGSPVPKKFINNCKELAVNLQVLRDDFRKPIKVLSGYRTRSHNKKIGGASDSYHLTASAGDIRIDGVPSHVVYMRLLKLMTLGKIKKGGLKCYPSWVHYDIRGKEILF